MKSLSRFEYEAAFQLERVNEYAEVDAFEVKQGFAISRDRIESAAKILACPLKAHPPNWQHGRVIYSALRRYLTQKHEEPINLFDCGTAKGFSALCMAFALEDSHVLGQIISVDVVDPEARIPRNSIADLEPMLHSVRDLVSRWVEAKRIVFVRSTGADWLESHPIRIHFAFIDGKHTYASVKEEGRLLMACQKPGDITFFDDVQYPGVGHAIDELKGYTVQRFAAKYERRYAVATRV